MYSLTNHIGGKNISVFSFKVLTGSCVVCIGSVIWFSVLSYKQSQQTEKGIKSL